MNIESFAAEKGLTVGEAFRYCWEEFTGKKIAKLNPVTKYEIEYRTLKDYQTWRDHRVLPTYVHYVLKSEERRRITMRI